MTLDEKEMLCEEIRKSMKIRGAKSVSIDIGKPYSTLMNEINAFHEEHKLGLFTLIDILDIVDPKAILEMICARYNLTVTPMHKEKDTVEHMNMLMFRAAKEHGDIAKVYYEAIRDDKIDDVEKRDLIKEIEDDIRIKTTIKNSLAEL